MKKILLSIAVTAGMTSAALAADIPVKAARPMLAPPVVTTNWTGCYVGAGGGYGMWNQEHRTLDPQRVPFVGQVGDVTSGGRGWFGTVQVGCDYQFGNRWVLGAFGDWDFGSLKGNMSPAIFNNFILGEEKLRYSWAAGGRVGYLIAPSVLGYISAGYTQARFDGVTFAPIVVPGAAATFLSMDAQTYGGWFIGSGYEYALDFLPGLFWKTEYRYATYGAKQVPLRLNVAGVQTLFGYEDSKKYVQTIRTELVYRFNWGGAGPVMAKY
jgi:outer membrane immunogenic protein